MARRSRGSTGQRRRSYRSRARQSPQRSEDAWQRDLSTSRRGAGRRGEPRRTLETVRERRSARQTRTIVSRGRRDQSPRRNRDELQTGRKHRRANLRTSRENTARRLPRSSLPVFRRNENASDPQTTRSVCTRKKQARRAVIIATGYGGVNNQRNYRRHKQCR